jgi:hypothetical protein
MKSQEIIVTRDDNMEKISDTRKTMLAGGYDFLIVAPRDSGSDAPSLRVEFAVTKNSDGTMNLEFRQGGKLVGEPTAYADVKAVQADGDPRHVEIYAKPLLKEVIRQACEETVRLFTLAHHMAKNAELLSLLNRMDAKAMEHQKGGCDAFRV